VPDKIDQAPLTDLEAIKRSLKSPGDYKGRMRSIEALGAHDSKQSRDILWDVMLHDPIHSVQNQAFLKLQAFGESVRLPRKNPKHLKTANDKIKTVQGMVDFLADRPGYLRLFAERYPKEFEVLSYEKKNKLESHIENVIRHLPKR